MVRDCGEVFDPKVQLLPKAPTQEEINFFKEAWDRSHAPIEWDVEKEEDE